MDTPKITPEKVVEMFGVSPEEQAAYTASREGIIKGRKDVRPLQESVSPEGKEEPVDWELLEYQEYLDSKNQKMSDQARGDWLKEKHFLASGTSVKTTQENLAVSDWTQEARMSRQWGVQGIIVTHHDAHGLSYEVRHPDGSIGHYDPSEIEVIE